MIAAGTGVGGRMAVQWWRRSRSSPMHGSIGRAVTWTGKSGTLLLLSGPSKGTMIDGWCDTETTVGEHVVLVESTSNGWRVIHLDEA